MGHAPQLLGYEQVPGGWHIVVMEYLEGYFSLNATSRDSLPRWESDMKELMVGFHSRNLVHGDLRTANILVPGDGSNKPVMLVDFDWGGEVGMASYPTYRLNEELVIDRLGKLSNLHITKSDDIRIMQHAFHPDQVDVDA